jgi:peptidoglycan/xylan/chitin deacetylase (PgdA/CDA1 family)
MWRLAHNIGTENHSNYNTIEQIVACQEPIGFDGIYRNVYENREILKGKTGIFFVMGNYMGKDNTFDLPHVPKLEQYCTWDEMVEMLMDLPDFHIGWHTWSHPDLTTLSREEIMKEITPPFPMDTFAYPYGRYNDLVVQCVKEAGFKKAYSVTQGSTNPNDPDHQFKIYRDYIR